MQQPLSYRLRPETLDEFIGLDNLLSCNTLLKNCVKNKSLLSMIFFVYFATLTSFKIDFKHHLVNSTLNTSSSYVGLIMSIISFIGFCHL